MNIKTLYKVIIYAILLIYMGADLYWGGPLKRAIGKRLTSLELVENSKRGEQAVAKVYGEYITQDEFLTRVREELFLSGKSEKEFTTKDFYYFKMAVLDRMIEDELIHLKTKTNDLGLPLSREQSEQDWLDFTQRFETDDALNQSLASANLDPQWMQWIIEARIQQEGHLHSIIDPLSVPTEEDILVSYKDLKNVYEPISYREVSHLFFSTLNQDKEAVLTKAKEILEKIQQGEDFAQLAKLHSEDKKSAPQGGSLGNISNKRQLPGNLQESIFKLPDNTPTLVESSMGVHIMTAGPAKIKELPKLEELRPKLTSTLAEIRRQIAIDRYLAILKREARQKKRITIFSDRL